MPCALHAALSLAKHLNPRGQGEEEAGRWRTPPRRLEVCGLTSAGFPQPGPGQSLKQLPPGDRIRSRACVPGTGEGDRGGLAGSGCPDAP